MSKLGRRITESLVGGVLILVLLVVFMFVGSWLEVAGLFSVWLLTIAGLFFVFASPGFLFFMPIATPDDPHPPFTATTRVLALLMNIAVYALIVCAVLGWWRFFRSRSTRLS